MEREAEGHEMMSIPRPKGERVTNLSAERLIASQNEASRIVRKMERLQSGPLKPNATNMLRDEYARGIETGGAEGVAICKGALMAADELGVSEEEFLGPLRTPEQQAELDKAVPCHMMARSISTRIPEPPLTRTGDKTPGRGMSFVPRDRRAQRPKGSLTWLQR